MNVVIMMNMNLVDQLGYSFQERGVQKLKKSFIILLENFVWQLGMVFKDVKEFRQAVTKYAVKRRFELEKWVNKQKKVRVRCKDGCPGILYGCLDKTTNNFMIRTYNPKHTWNKTTRNYLCNA